MECVIGVPYVFIITSDDSMLLDVSACVCLGGTKCGSFTLEQTNSMKCTDVI